MKQMIRLLFAVVLALAVIVAYQFQSISNTRTTAKRQTCQRFAVLDQKFISLIRQGERSLGQIDYYKKHPAEKQRAIEADEHAIRVLTPPPYCN